MCGKEKAQCSVASPYPVRAVPLLLDISLKKDMNLNEGLFEWERAEQEEIDTRDSDGGLVNRIKVHYKRVKVS
jgi:hypothetical protein